MKKLAKIGLAVGVVVGVGALACYGLKKLLEKADCCGCCDGNCDCEGDGYMGTCECDCHCHDKVEPATEPAQEKVCDDAPAEDEAKPQDAANEVAPPVAEE